MSDIPEAVRVQMSRLGLTERPPLADAYLASSCSWAVLKSTNSWRGADPLGQLTAFPATLRWFAAVDWGRGDFELTEDDEPRRFDAALFSENWDMRDESRVLMFFIGWDPDAQVLYGLDALDPSDDPPVLTTDHDGSEPATVAFERLSDFLAALSRVPGSA